MQKAEGKKDQSTATKSRRQRHATSARASSWDTQPQPAAGVSSLLPLLVRHRGRRTGRGRGVRRAGAEPVPVPPLLHKPLQRRLPRHLRVGRWSTRHVLPSGDAHHLRHRSRFDGVEHQHAPAVHDCQLRRRGLLPEDDVGARHQQHRGLRCRLCRNHPASRGGLGPDAPAEHAARHREPSPAAAIVLVRHRSRFDRYHDPLVKFAEFARACVRTLVLLSIRHGDNNRKAALIGCPGKASLLVGPNGGKIGTEKLCGRSKARNGSSRVVWMATGPKRCRRADFLGFLSPRARLELGAVSAPRSCRWFRRRRKWSRFGRARPGFSAGFCLVCARLATRGPPSSRRSTIAHAPRHITQCLNVRG